MNLNKVLFEMSEIGDKGERAWRILEIFIFGRAKNLELVGGWDKSGRREISFSEKEEAWKVLFRV